MVQVRVNFKKIDIHNTGENFFSSSAKVYCSNKKGKILLFIIFLYWTVYKFNLYTKINNENVKIKSFLRIDLNGFL